MFNDNKIDKYKYNRNNIKFIYNLYILMSKNNFSKSFTEYLRTYTVSNQATDEFDYDLAPIMPTKSHALILTMLLKN